MAETAGSVAGGGSLDGTDAGIALSDFNSWMISEQRHVHLLCLRMLRNREEADAASQDTFLKAYRALQKTGGSDIDDPTRWVTRIALNTCLDRLRSRRWLFWRQRMPAEDEEIILQLARATGPGPDELIFANEIARRLSKALDRLSGRQRSVFILRHDEDRSLEEIGEILGLDTGTVKSHLARAVGKLREELRDLYEH